MPTPFRALRRHWRASRWALIARANAARPRRPRAVFLGDSLTREWLEADPGFFLAHRRVSAGVNGETTRDMLARFEADVIARAPKIVHIMAGTNDLWHGSPGPDAGAALANLAEMADRAGAAGIAVILAAPPPISPGAAALFGRPDLLPALRAGVARLAAGRGLGFVDYAEALGDGAGGIAAPLTTDGVHLSRAGYRAIRPLAERALAMALRAGR